MSSRRIVLLALAAGFCPSFAQQRTPPQPAKPAPEWLQQYREKHGTELLDDFGGLRRYRDANAALPAPTPKDNRVVFFGDSITDYWKLDQYFPGKPYMNRGIAAQTTSQMLLRFHADVIALQPKTVIILAGVNDLSGITGPISLEGIEANYASMVDLARVNHIKVILASVLPVNEYSKEAAGNLADLPPEQIASLNRWLKEYSAKHDCTYLDYFSALVDEKGYFKKELAQDDGIHPNDAGYQVMASLAQKAIDRIIPQHRPFDLGPPESKQ